MTASIPLYFGGGIVAYALVDDGDVDRLSARRWYFSRQGYAVAQRGRLMAREVAGIPTGDPRTVHHRNEDKLDNRRENLEVCASRSEANRQLHPLREAKRRRQQQLKWRRKEAA